MKNVRREKNMWKEQEVFHHCHEIDGHKYQTLIDEKVVVEPIMESAVVMKKKMSVDPPQMPANQKQPRLSDNVLHSRDIFGQAISANFFMDGEYGFGVELEEGMYNVPVYGRAEAGTSDLAHDQSDSDEDIMYGTQSTPVRAVSPAHPTAAAPAHPAPAPARPGAGGGAGAAGSQSTPHRQGCRNETPVCTQ